jgi:hypothetical protein
MRRREIQRTSRRWLAAARLAALTAALITGAASADAQDRHPLRHHHERETKEPDRPAPVASVDKRDTLVAAGGSAGRPYWLALAQCGGVYFKLSQLYTDVAVRARAVKPDPRVNSEFTKKLNEAIGTATAYFTAAERFLMGDRGIERVDAVLIYDPQARAAGDQIKSIDAGLAAAASCPALYQSCRQNYAKTCSEPLAPTS